MTKAMDTISDSARRSQRGILPKVQEPNRRTAFSLRLALFCLLVLCLGAAFSPLAGAAHAAPPLPASRIVAWGKNDYGEATVPTSLTGVVAVSAGYQYNLALKADGTVVAWGKNDYGRANVPAGLSGVVAVSAGGFHSLALKADGTVAAWGYNGNGATNVPAGLSGVVAVSAGDSFSLALKSDGTVAAWGDNTSGQLNIPTRLSGVAAVSAGSFHSLALVTIGTPTANPQSVAVPFNTATVVTITGSDPNSPPLPLTDAIASGPVHGTLTGTVAGLTYTPTAGYHGADSFTFTVSNGTNTSAPATISITMATGVPTASAQSVAVAFNTAKAVTLSGSDPDVPALPLTYTLATNPANGTLTGTAPNLTYTPTAGYHGTDSLTFTVNNGVNTSAPATVTLTVAAGTPTASSQSVVTSQNTAVRVTLTGTDPDVPALSLTYSVITGPAHGALTGTGAHLTYTPTAGYFGPDSFTFTTSNGTNTSAQATISLTVTQAAAQDVTAQVTVTRGGFRYVRATGHYIQPVTLANTGAALADPISLVLDNLTGATLVGASGTTAAAQPAGSPYVTLPSGGRAAGASTTVTLEFTAQPSGYAPRVLAGPGAR